MSFLKTRFSWLQPLSLGKRTKFPEYMLTSKWSQTAYVSSSNTFLHIDGTFTFQFLFLLLTFYVSKSFFTSQGSNEVFPIRSSLFPNAAWNGYYLHTTCFLDIFLLMCILVVYMSVSLTMAQKLYLMFVDFSLEVYKYK